MTVTPETITLGRVAELEAAGFQVVLTMHYESGKARRSWHYIGPDKVRSHLDYETTAHAWAAASVDPAAPGNLDEPATASPYLDRFPAAARPFCERAYNDGVRDGESYGETLATAIRAAFEKHTSAHEGEAFYMAISAALAEYEAEGSPEA